jgi:hypothetical protein
MTWDKNKT